MPDPDPVSVHASCLDALVTVISGLGLIGITAVGTQTVVSDLGTVGSTKMTGDDGKLSGSFVSVSPWGQEDVVDFTNARDLTTYRCLVAIIAKRDTPTLARKLEWRAEIRKRLMNLKIGVTAIRKCNLQLNPVVEANAYVQRGTFLSTMVVLCESVEARATA